MSKFLSFLLNAGFAGVAILLVFAVLFAIPVFAAEDAPGAFADGQLGINQRCPPAFVREEGLCVLKQKSEYIRSLHTQAERGDANAQYNLGLSYAMGLLVPQDSAESLKWYRRAATQGHVKAQEALSKIKEEPFLHGADNAAKLRVRLSRERAERGDAAGQFNLGKWYYFGEGVPQDHTEAAKWFRLAAEQGLPRAQFRLGTMYRNGEGVPQSHRESFVWHFLAAENGFPSAEKHRDDNAELLSPTELADAKLEATRRHAEIGNYFASSPPSEHAARIELTAALSAEPRVEQDSSDNGSRNSQRCPSNIEKRDDLGWTPLHRAAEKNDHNKVAFLIGCNANVSALDKFLWTPLHWAAQSNSVQSIVDFLSNGADIEAKSDIRDVPLGPELSAPTVLEGARTPLHIAAGHGNVEAVAALLDKGANIEARDVHGDTPLHKAVGGLRLEAAGQLYVYLTREEPIDRPKEKLRAVVTELIKRGANIHATNETGKTPMQLAATLDKYEIVDELQKAAQRSREVPREFPKTTFSIADTEAGGVFESIWRSVVVIETGGGQGSGVALKPNLVATNCHVTDAATSPIAVFKGENRRADKSQSHPARVVAGDRKRDVCLLEVSGLWAIPAETRPAAEMKIAEQVYAVGAPKGLDFSISGGLVSQLRGEDAEGNALVGSAPLIQTDTAISPGSSGGGLFDAQGKLVGLTTFGYRDSEGLNFAVPIEWALELVPETE